VVIIGEEVVQIEFQQDICSQLEQVKCREWLETNGIGGFASSTIAGMNTRRYHGLLVAATRPPVGRYVLLSKLEETLVIGDERIELGCNQYPGTIHPCGYQRLTRFRLDPWPVFTYEVDGIELEKSVLMPQGENTTVVTYSLRSAMNNVKLEIRPLIAFRDYHSTTHENTAINREVVCEPNLVAVEPYPGLPRLYLAHEGIVIRTGEWYRNFEYEAELERGLDYREDLFNPFRVQIDFTGSRSFHLLASTELQDIAQAASLCESERSRRSNLVSNSPSDHPLIEALTRASDQFIVARGEHKTIIAGYHWFSDWGRDTMISLPGLTLATGRFDAARDILLEFSNYVDRGMLPNRFPDLGERPEYNTVDATLWYFEAIRAYFQYTQDKELVEKLYPVLVEIIEWHLRGTRYGICVESGTSLLTCGEPGIQLTWMDAKVGEWVVTPRYGKPVEIQALWYNALRIMESFATQLDDASGRRSYAARAQKASWSFNRLFWSEQAGCLYDVVVNGGPPDSSLRPNQIFAVSLPHSMLSAERARTIVDVVQRELFTPLGLRTLPQWDSRYVGHYGGDQLKRDGAYHQGTVWPWLLGPFITAYLKVTPNLEEARQTALAWIEGFAEHLKIAGLGQISEIADAESPHLPKGCVAQAWSVAELLRAAVEDIGIASRARLLGH
jgi:predicted glycogen debranching enzyme